MTTERRPDPNELLARVKEAATRERRGKLESFFGAAAGAGTTYPLLDRIAFVALLGLLATEPAHRPGRASVSA
jgi:hypothetical protein